jgi:hypothetical protein
MKGSTARGMPVSFRNYFANKGSVVYEIGLFTAWVYGSFGLQVPNSGDRHHDQDKDEDCRLHPGFQYRSG